MQIEMSLLAVTSPDGTLLALETSGVDAHLVAKPVPGARVFRCFPNCQSPELIAQTPLRVRSDSEENHGSTTTNDFENGESVRPCGPER